MLVYVPPGKTIDYLKLNTILGRIKFYLLREVPLTEDPDFKVKYARNRNEAPKFERFVQVS